VFPVGLKRRHELIGNEILSSDAPKGGSDGAGHSSSKKGGSATREGRTKKSIDAVGARKKKKKEAGKSRTWCVIAESGQLTKLNEHQGWRATRARGADWGEVTKENGKNRTKREEKRTESDRVKTVSRKSLDRTYKKAGSSPPKRRGGGKMNKKDVRALQRVASRRSGKKVAIKGEREDAVGRGRGNGIDRVDGLSKTNQPPGLGRRKRGHRIALETTGRMSKGEGREKEGGTFHSKQGKVPRRLTTKERGEEILAKKKKKKKKNFLRSVPMAGGDGT